jgi:hypothetical protein
MTRALIALLVCVSSALTGVASASADLTNLPDLKPGAESRMVSPENPTGDKGKGAMALPNPRDADLSFSSRAEHLGRGWKVRPFIKVAAHSTVTIMDVDGPGTIEHIWMTSSITNVQIPKGSGRATVLRFYWDAEETPSVESPLTDFFAIGHERFATVNSSVVVDVPGGSMNCYWPMPFRKHARITVTNDSDKELPLFTYQIDYRLGALAAQTAYFHAQFREARVSASNPEYTIVDGIRGHGRYVGTFLEVTQTASGWFGEGEVKFYLDGDKKFPTIAGTGTEDYFGGAWDLPTLYSTEYVGNVLDPKTNPDPDGGPPQYSLYRWHIPDPVEFRSDLRVTIQDLYDNEAGYLPGEDSFASVAYWYQEEPHAPYPQFPALAGRRSR